jgi:hypothetical protein
VIDRFLTGTALASSAMTPDTPAPAPTEGGSSRPSWLVPVIVIVAVVVLVGGAFVVYKLTKSTSSAEAPYVVVHRTVVAIKGGQSPKSSDTSGQGEAELDAITAQDLEGLQFGGCQALPQAPNTARCIWSRPGGQMTMSLSKTDGHWKITGAGLGPAGLPPDDSTTASSTPPSS